MPETFVECSGIVIAPLRKARGGPISFNLVALEVRLTP